MIDAETGGRRGLVLFDFDGVVVDSLDFYEDIVRETLALIGTPLDEGRESFLALFDDNFYRSLSDRGVDVPGFNAALRTVMEHADYCRVRLFPDVLPLVDSLRKRHYLAVVSSSSRTAIDVLLGTYGCLRCFDAVFAADAALGKVEKIAAARSRWDIACGETWYVGDTVGDVREARGAGVGVIAASWGWHARERLAQAVPDYIVDSPEELQTLLAALCGGDAADAGSGPC